MKAVQLSLTVLMERGWDQEWAGFSLVQGSASVRSFSVFSTIFVCRHMCARACQLQSRHTWEYVRQYEDTDVGTRVPVRSSGGLSLGRLALWIRPARTVPPDEGSAGLGSQELSALAGRKRCGCGRWPARGHSDLTESDAGLDLGHYASTVVCCLAQPSHV